MIEYFKNFIRHSMVYGVGNGIYRLASFLLIPLYTRVLLPSDYGELELLYVFSGILRTFLGVMIAHSTLRFYFEFDNEVERKQVVSTSFVVSLFLSIFGVVVLWNFLPQISSMIFKSTQYYGLLRIVLLIVAVELSKEIGLAFLRAKEKSLLYIIMAIVQLLSQVGLNLYFILHLRLGVKGILLGNLISAAIGWIVISTITIKFNGLRLNFHKLKLLLRYCLPLVLSALAGVIINSTGRLMLNNYKDLAAVGIYALALKFGMGLQELVIEPFSMNFGQSRFAIMRQPDAKAIYAKVMTYFTFVLVFISLAIAIFSRDILTLISSKAFISGYKVIPLVLMSVLVGGITYIFQTGIMIEKKTKSIFYITTFSAVLTLVLNRVLIPVFDMFGAAIASLLVVFFSCWLTYYFSNKYYKIHYEIARLFKIIFAAIFLYLITIFLIDSFFLNFFVSIILKLILLINFPLILGLLSFYEISEINRFKWYLKRICR